MVGFGTCITGDGQNDDGNAGAAGGSCLTADEVVVTGGSSFFLTFVELLCVLLFVEEVNKAWA